jgi:hypothetical protein
VVSSSFYFVAYPAALAAIVLNLILLELAIRREHVEWTKANARSVAVDYGWGGRLVRISSQEGR